MRWLILLLIPNISYAQYSWEDFRGYLREVHDHHSRMIEQDTEFSTEWHEWLDSLDQRPEKKIIEQVNFRVNRTKFVADQENYGKDEYWTTPAEFFNRGGDCEDFAIAKYFALLELDIPSEKLAITIGMLGEDVHAVLTYWDTDDPLVLDNTRRWPQRLSKRRDFERTADIRI